MSDSIQYLSDNTKEIIYLFLQNNFLISIYNFHLGKTNLKFAYHMVSSRTLLIISRKRILYIDEYSCLLRVFPTTE